MKQNEKKNLKNLPSLFVGLIGFIGLYSLLIVSSWKPLQAQEESMALSGNAEFERYFKRLAQMEWELISFELPAEVVEKSGGDLTKFFNLYENEIKRIRDEVGSEKPTSLTQLEKKTLWVYAQKILVFGVYSPRYTILLSSGDHDQAAAMKEKIIVGQNQIVAAYKDSRITKFEHTPNGEKDQLKSFLLSLYADNFFLSTGFQKSQFFDFAHESHSLYKEALWYDSQNLWAVLGYANFYVATAYLDPLNSRIADRNYRKILSYFFQPPSSENLVNLQDAERSLILSTWIGMSQSAITRRDYSTAEEYLNLASQIAPQSGYLNYVKQAAEKNLTIFNHSREKIIGVEKDSSVNFFYSYQFESWGRFLYKNYFHFLSDDIDWTVFMNVGNSFNPSSLLLEEGLAIGFGNWGVELGALQNPLFEEGIGSYTGFVGAHIDSSYLYIKFLTHYGLFYNYMPENSDGNLEFRLKNHQAISTQLSWETFLYRSSLTRLKLRQNTEYRYSLDQKVHILTVSLTLPWILIDNLWGELYVKNGLDFAYSSDPRSIRNRVEFFKRTPNSLKQLAGRLTYYETPLSGNLLIHHFVSYRFYPLFFMNTYSAAKGLFIEPSFYWGTVFNDVGNIDQDFPQEIRSSYSILGSLGYRFPGDRTVSLGAGWNDRDGVVLNILMH